MASVITVFGSPQHTLVQRRRSPRSPNSRQTILNKVHDTIGERPRNSCIVNKYKQMRRIPIEDLNSQAEHETRGFGLRRLRLALCAPAHSALSYANAVSPLLRGDTALA
ncbi:hypothetical protein EVAR_38515_1 [Eumeta japonica]|uniref:Uncharacterized protein n=1 Tax=Eumeta variegata TaxID=151549 RepID=A0A4C1WBV8_EUMVA|nr:hypothetical protein EVAR_38515_1 [Eumeta japonica]